jgi:hypothetical protein
MIAAAHRGVNFSSVPIPLREGRRDWFFIVVFALFASTSCFIDTANMFGRPNPYSHNPRARLLYAQVGGHDPLLMANPRFVQLSVGFVSVEVLAICHPSRIWGPLAVKSRGALRSPNNRSARTAAV